MSLRVKLALWAIGIGLVCGFYVVGTGSLRLRLQNVLSDAFQQRVTVQSLALRFPLGVRMSGIAMPNAAGQETPPISIREAVAQLDLGTLLKGRPRFALELKAPRLRIERNPQGSIQFSLLRKTTPEGRLQVLGIPVSRLRVRDGELILLDQAVAPQVSGVLRDLSVSLVSGSQRGQYTVNVRGLLEGGSREPLGILEANGEMILPTTAEFKISVTHKEVARLEPYLRQILGAAPSQGAIHLVSTVTLFNGGLVADSRLTATGLAFLTDDPTVLGPSGNHLVQILQDSKGVVNLSFIVKGRLGEPLDWSNLVESTLREAMRQALAQNIRRALTDAEQGGSLEEAIRRGMDSIGR